MSAVDLLEEGVAEPPPGAIHREPHEPETMDAVVEPDAGSVTGDDWVRVDVLPPSSAPSVRAFVGAGRPQSHRSWRPAVTPSAREGPARTGDAPTASRELLAALETLPRGTAREVARAVQEVAATLRGGFERLDPSIWGEAGSEGDYARAAIHAAVEARRGREHLIEHSYTLEEAAELLHMTPSEVEHLLEGAQLAGIVDDGHWHLPHWQFENGHLIDGVAEIVQAFPGGMEWLTAWMTTPHPELDGDTPRDQALQGASGTVVALARALHG